jgi:TniQ
MSAAVAPTMLPFAPRPYSSELLSSWLLRVAAANLVSLRELLDGFQRRYGQILSNYPIDYGIPDAAVTALAQFCQIAPARIRALDLRERAPHLSPALILRFHTTSLVWSPRCSLRRVCYAFCPACLASQKVIHVRWEWSVACLIRCAIHRTPLLDGCPACREPDPLVFSSLVCSPIYACRSCGADLSASLHDAGDVQRKSDIQAIEDAYRAMLLGIAPDPALLGKATDRAFRQFVEDMLQLLTRNLNPYCPWQTGSPVPFSRRDILQIITALIENAAPSTDGRIRSRRYSRGLILWTTLLSMLTDTAGGDIERSSLRWPASLRRRFISALYYCKGTRWPCSPYGTNLAMQTAQREIRRIYGLRPPLRSSGRTS